MVYDAALKREGEEVPTDGEGGGDDEYMPSKLVDFIDESNLIEELDKTEDRTKVGADLKSKYDEDKVSMEAWDRKYKTALTLAQMQPESEKKTFPFAGASTAMLPFIQEAMIDFNARTSPELVFTRNVINVKIYGRNTTEKEQRARRTGIYLNYQLSENMKGWRRNQDKLLYILPCVGTVYKKTYWDYAEEEVRSDLVLADNIVFDHESTSFEEADDYFQAHTFTKNELICYIRGEQAWDIDIEDDLDEEGATYNFIEAHSWYDLDGDDLDEPYMFMYWVDKSRIVSMTADYEIDDILLNDDDEVIKIERCEQITQYQFMPDPEGGPMGMGWGILMGPMFKAINTNVRQLIDAGTLANTAANSGLIATSIGKGRGGRNQAGPVRVKQGQLTPIDAGGMTGSIRDNVVQFPFAGPNGTLFELMGYLVESARQLTAAAKQVDVNANQAASMYLAQLQQALKIPNSITMRVYDAATMEFKKIAHLNYLYYDDDKYNRVLDMQGATESDIPQPQDTQEAPTDLPPGEAPVAAPVATPVPEEPSSFSMEEDFDPDDCDIRIIADPSQGSQMERAARADAIYQMAMAQPQPIIDLREATLDVLQAMGTPDIDKLAPKPDPNARDPMKELMIAKMQADEEAAERDRSLRARDQQLKEQQLAIQAAEMQYKASMERIKLGLEDDKLESEIVRNYAAALKDIVTSSQETLESGLQTIQQLKSMIDVEEDGESDNGSRAAIKTIAPGPAA